MKHGSLFSGIGGFDLAAEWMGWENIFHCEWMEFPRKVLDYYWPNADSHVDICKTDFTKYANTIDILTGGFPCQPFSLAGKRKGTDDERYLWHEMLRAIREIKPKWVIAENVFGITNIDGGMVFEQVCLDLEAEGYEVQPFIIPAASKNAPHVRQRVWFVAQNTNCIGLDDRETNSGRGRNREFESTRSIREIDETHRDATNPDSNGQHERNSNDEINASERGINALGNIEQSIGNGNATDTESKSSEWLRFEQREFSKQEQRQFRGNNSEMGNGIATDTSSRRISGHRGESKGQSLQATELNENDCKFYRPMDWREFPTQSPICSRNDGLSTKLDGITFSKWRNESIKGYGNAIVPQIAYQLFQIIEHESKNKNTKDKQPHHVPYERGGTTERNNSASAGSHSGT